MLHCGLKRIHAPGLSKEVFLHHFLNSVWLLDDFLSGNGLRLADPPEALGTGELSPAYLSVFPARPKAT